MKRTLAAVMIAMAIRICSITALAAFSTFVWTEEYRSELYAVEIMDEGVDNTAATTDAQSITVFDTAEDELATPTDLDSTSPDEGMNDAVDDVIEEEPDSVAQFITSYDIELEVVEDGMEPEEEQPIPDEGMNVTGDEPKDDTDTDVIFITSYDIEPAAREEDIEPQQEDQEDQEG